METLSKHSVARGKDNPFGTTPRPLLLRVLLNIDTRSCARRCISTNVSLRGRWEAIDNRKRDAECALRNVTRSLISLLQ